MYHVLKKKVLFKKEAFGNPAPNSAARRLGRRAAPASPCRPPGLLPTTYYLLLTTHYPLPTTYYLLLLLIIVIMIIMIILMIMIMIMMMIITRPSAQGGRGRGRHGAADARARGLGPRRWARRRPRRRLERARAGEMIHINHETCYEKWEDATYTRRKQVKNIIMF